MRDLTFVTTIVSIVAYEIHPGLCFMVVGILGLIWAKVSHEC